MFLPELDFQLRDVFDADRLMPPDILSKVLRHLCSDGPLPLRHVLFVSKGFYNAAVNDPFLWTIISIDAEFFSHFRGRLIKQTNNFTEQCLLRSGVLPLRLCIHTSGLLDPNHLYAPLKIFRNSKYKGFERCTSLVWFNEFPNLVRRIMALLPAELPSLQHISLSHFRYDMGESKFPHCPLLQRAELFYCSLYSTVPWAKTFAHVTTLSIRISTFSARYALAVSPRLRELTICAGSTLYLNSSLAALTLQYLRILRVRGSVFEDMLANFTAPNLEELHIEADPDGTTAIDALRDWRYELRCLRLYVLLPKTVRAEEPTWATGLSEVVRKCKRLATLHISKWMEKGCKELMNNNFTHAVLHVL